MRNLVKDGGDLGKTVWFLKIWFIKVYYEVRFDWFTKFQFLFRNFKEA